MSGSVNIDKLLTGHWKYFLRRASFSCARSSEGEDGGESGVWISVRTAR